MSRPTSRWETPILVTGLILAIASGVIAYRLGGPYGERFERNPRVKQIANDVTGELEVLAWDMDGNLRLDTWSYLEEGRLLRREFDDDEDGAVDHWCYYRPDQSLERHERDTDGDGVADVRTLFDAEGTEIGNVSVTADGLSAVAQGEDR